MYVGIFVLMFSCAIIISWFCNGFPSLGIDDAHIFFNYAIDFPLALVIAIDAEKEQRN
jgi:hypothetical protein